MTGNERRNVLLEILLKETRKWVPFKATGLSFGIAIGYKSRLGVFSNSGESFCIVACFKGFFNSISTLIFVMIMMLKVWKSLMKGGKYENIELLFYIVFILVVVVFVLYRNNSTSYSTLRESLETSLSLLSILRHQGNWELKTRFRKSAMWTLLVAARRITDVVGRSDQKWIRYSLGVANSGVEYWGD